MEQAAQRETHFYEKTYPLGKSVMRVVLEKVDGRATLGTVVVYPSAAIAVPGPEETLEGNPVDARALYAAVVEMMWDLRGAVL